jgi:hypothetical protein
MPRIPEVILNSIVYLYADKDDADTGVDSGGSGFLTQMPSENCKTASHIYAVTNAHVIERGSPVVRVNLTHPSSGYERTYSFEFTASDWVVHPEHDLAVCALPTDVQSNLYRVALIDTKFLLSEKDVIEKDIGPGDDVVYVGRFMGHAGKYQNMPSVRFGNISMNPNPLEPIESEVNGRLRKQVGFLVEARSRSGYSGSPVFFLHQPAVNDRRIVFAGFDLRILGVDWGHIPERVPLQDPHGRLHGSNWYVEVHAGMMGVVPSWYLLDFLNTAPRLIAQRIRDDDYYNAHPVIGVPE